MANRTYIFLDVDGVLNNSASVMAYEGTGSSRRPWRLDEVSVRLVAHLADRTNAHIVVSSSWRGGGPEKFAAMMACYGWYNCPVIGETRFRKQVNMFDPESLETRGEVIRSWIEREAPGALDEDRYLIVDDEKEAGDTHPDGCFLKTTMRKGFRRLEFSAAMAKIKGRK